MHLTKTSIWILTIVFVTRLSYTQTGWVQQTTPLGSKGLGNIQFVSPTEGWIDEYSGRLLHTTDVGANWKFVSPFPNDTVSSLSMCWVNQTHGWEMNCFGTSQSGNHGGVVYSTTDGGNTWQKKVLTTSVDSIGYGVQFVDENNGWATFYLTSIGSGLSRTTDGGNTWSPITHYPMVGSSYFVDANNGWSTTRYASGGSPLYWSITHTTDGGTNWSVQYTDVGNAGATLNAIQFTDLNHGWVAGDSAKIFKTTNGGINWTQVTNSGLTTNANSSCVFFWDANNGWIGTNIPITVGLGPQRAILHTTDGGSSWTWQYPTFLLDSTKTHTAKLYSFYFRDVNNGWFTSDYSIIGHTTNGGVTGVEEGENPIPSEYSLSQNYPNPFNPSTRFSFTLSASSFVSLKIFDLLGREVATVVSDNLSAGNHTQQWNANGMPSGIYFYRLRAGSFTETKKLVLLR